jgi:DNA primase
MMHDHVQIRFLFLPEGEDPDSLIRKEGKTCFEERITTAHSLSAFLLQSLSKQNDMNTLEGRACFAASALTYIKQLEPGFLQSMLLDELSKRARVDMNELKKQLGTSEPVFADQFKKPASGMLEENKSKLPPLMRQALALLVQFPRIALSLNEQLTTTLPGANFLNQLIEIIKKNPEFTTGGLLEYFRGQKEETAIAKLAAITHVVPENGVDREFSGMIRQLNIMGINEKVNQLLTKAAQDGLSESEKLALTEAIAEKQKLSTDTVS